MQSIIAHIDMNSYFATCEQQDNLSWRGKPVGVCEHLGGIIIAASVEAKKWGIKTGTPVWEAKRIYPKIIITKTNPNRYRHYTARFLKVFADYTDQIEKYSIDEAFLDLTVASNVRAPYRSADGEFVLKLVDPWEEAKRIALEIKERMKTEVGDWITCSVGISYSKLVAKIASDLQKPNGMVIVKPSDKNSLYRRLKLTDIPGIGSRMEKQLNTLGIKTLDGLRDYPLSKLVSHFGIYGYHLHSMGQLEGSWKEDFSESVNSMQSIGHMYTIPSEFRKHRVMKQVLYKLSEMVASRLRVNEVMGNSVFVHVRDCDHNGAYRGGKLDFYLRDGRDIYLQAMRLLKSTGENLEELDRKLSRVGVTVGGLTPYVRQDDLFSRRPKQKLLQALDKINDKYDDFTIARTPAFLARDIIRDSVGFGRMKEFKTTFMAGSQSRFG